MNVTRHLSYLLGIATFAAAPIGSAQGPLKSNEEFAKYAMKLREAAISSIEPRVNTPTVRSVWKMDIITTTFWVGENSSVNNPVHNRSSSWDADWAGTFGGFDNPDPAKRIADPAKGEYRAAAFIPNQNPFYVALPYNDTTRGTTKPEAEKVIPWFRSVFEKPGQSVCRDRWLAVRSRRSGRIAYAQWSDCGPFRTDHFEYVFGTDKPKPNLNGGAGLDVSPSVRDFLKINSTDVTDWRFVDARDVPPGPWRTYGTNNPFFLAARDGLNRVVSASTAKRPPEAAELPKINGVQMKR